MVQAIWTLESSLFMCWFISVISDMTHKYVLVIKEGVDDRSLNA